VPDFLQALLDTTDRMEELGITAERLRSVAVGSRIDPGIHRDMGMLDRQREAAFGEKTSNGRARTGRGDWPSITWMFDLGLDGDQVAELFPTLEGWVRLTYEKYDKKRPLYLAALRADDQAAAKAVGLPLKTRKTVRQLHGLQTKNRIQPDEAERMRELHAQGLKASEIAEQIGSTYYRVRNFLRRENLSLGGAA